MGDPLTAQPVAVFPVGLRGVESIEVTYRRESGRALGAILFNDAQYDIVEDGTFDVPVIDLALIAKALRHHYPAARLLGPAEEVTE